MGELINFLAFVGIVIGVFILIAVFLEVILFHTNNTTTIIDIIYAVLSYGTNSYYNSMLHYFIYSTFIRKPKFKKGEHVVYHNIPKKKDFTAVVEKIQLRGKDFRYRLSDSNTSDSYMDENRLKLSMIQKRDNIIDDLLS